MFLSHDRTLWDVDLSLFLCDADVSSNVTVCHTSSNMLYIWFNIDAF